MSKPDEEQLEEIDAVIKGMESDLRTAQAEYGDKALPEWGTRPEYPPSGGLAITEREYKMIHDCRRYEAGFKSGLPGHNLMILVAKLTEHLENLYGISPNDGPYVINQ